MIEKYFLKFFQKYKKIIHNIMIIFNLFAFE